MKISEQPARVLFVSNDPPGGAVTRYRCDNIAAALPPDRYRADVAYVGDARVRVNHDIVVLHRICDVYEGRRFLAAARACGAAVVYGMDDLVIDENAFDASDPKNERLRRFAPRHLTMLRACDGVLVSTAFLAEKAWAAVESSAGRAQNVFLVRNFLSEKLLRLSAEAVRRREMALPLSPEKVTLGYLSGTPTHDADLATIAAPLAEVLRRFPQAELLLVGPVGLPAALATFESRVRRHPLVPWEELPDVYAGLDINLAPLELDRPFNHAKSEIKYLEAGAAGVPTLCANGAGFREALAGSPSVADLLAGPAETDWIERLSHLIAGREARREAGRSAVRHVAAHGTQAGQELAIAAAFDAFLPLRQATDRSRAQVVNWPFNPKFAVKHALRRLGSAI